MIALHDKETGAFLGTITEAQLQFLIDQLEEESRKDRDYYINRDTLDLFQEQGMDHALLTLLQQGGSQGVGASGNVPTPASLDFPPTLGLENTAGRPGLPETARCC